jgi:hypothetical protein
MSITETLKNAAGRMLAAALPPGMMKNLRYFDLWERHGYHITPVHFYQQVPDTRTLPKDIFERESEMVGIDMNLEGQRALLREIHRDYGAEYADLSAFVSVPKRTFKYRNQAFGPVDADMLFGMIRKFKPQTFIEIGSGVSSIVAWAALEKNIADQPERPCRFIGIEPYPRDWLADRPSFAEIRAQKVEAIPMALFDGLRTGDMLFIDSTHTINVYNDVCYEFLEILPRLRPGVIVHIHDIVLPRIYYRGWYERRRFWNEQYLLQALLTHSSAFEVLWAGHYMHLKHDADLMAAIPSYARARESGDARLTEMGHKSFWIRRKETC